MRQTVGIVIMTFLSLILSNMQISGGNVVKIACGREWIHVKTCSQLCKNDCSFMQNAISPS